MEKNKKAEPKFKIGDRVSHWLHRDGTVEDYSEYSGLYTINIGGNRTYRALKHQIDLAVPEPKFELTVVFTGGIGCTIGPYNRRQAEAHLTEGVEWDKVDTITINRVKG